MNFPWRDNVRASALMVEVLERQAENIDGQRRGQVDTGTADGNAARRELLLNGLTGRAKRSVDGRLHDHAGRVRVSAVANCHVDVASAGNHPDELQPGPRDVKHLRLYTGAGSIPRRVRRNRPAQDRRDGDVLPGGSGEADVLLVMAIVGNRRFGWSTRADLWGTRSAAACGRRLRLRLRLWSCRRGSGRSRSRVRAASTTAAR